MRYIVLVSLWLLTPVALMAQSPYSLDDDLIHSIYFGRADDVKILLDKGANPNVRTPQGDPVLSLAIERNDKESVAMVKVLLDKGANPNTIDRSKTAPLAKAIEYDQPEMLASLIAHGADYHIKTNKGLSLVDLAKQSGHPEIATSIQQALGKEAADEAALHTPERFESMIRLYSFNSCSYQYWNYFLASRQNTDKENETKGKISASKAMLDDLLHQIEQYYPTTSMEDVKAISDDSAGKIYEELDAMVSNRNREEHGVGRNNDEKQRCQAIADAIKINFLPREAKSAANPGSAIKH